MLIYTWSHPFQNIAKGALYTHVLFLTWRLVICKCIHVSKNCEDSRKTDHLDRLVNMPDPIRIPSGSALKHWPEAGRMIFGHWLASGPNPFGQNLTQSARTKSDPGWFCTILSGTSVEEWNWVLKWETGSGLVAFCQKLAWRFLHTSLLLDQMCLAKPWPGHRDRIWDSFAQYDPCFLWKNETEMDAASWIWHWWSGPILAACWS